MLIGLQFRVFGGIRLCYKYYASSRVKHGMTVYSYTGSRVKPGMTVNLSTGSRVKPGMTTFHLGMTTDTRR